MQAEVDAGCSRCRLKQIQTVLDAGCSSCRLQQMQAVVNTGCSRCMLQQLQTLVDAGCSRCRLQQMQAVLDADCSRCRPGLWAANDIMGMDGVAVRQQQQQCVRVRLLDTVRQIVLVRLYYMLSLQAITLIMRMDVWLQPLWQCWAVGGSQLNILLCHLWNIILSFPL